MPATAIKKVRYIVASNGPCTLDDMEKSVYEIYPDGKCKLLIYRGRDCKASIKEEESVSTNKIMELYRARWNDE